MGLDRSYRRHDHLTNGPAVRAAATEANSQCTHRSDETIISSIVLHEDFSAVAAMDARSIGNLRIRFPVAAKTALATAGAKGGTPVSPMPPGTSLLAMMCTSISGASLIRKT